MSWTQPIWAYFWPVLAAGLIAGVIAGAIGFLRKEKRSLVLSIGILAALALASLWHGPLGAADRFTRANESRSLQWRPSDRE